MASLQRVIRFKRGGHKRHPLFQMVLSLKYKRNQADCLKRLGFLNLTPKEHALFVDLRNLGASLNEGAVLNATVKKYLSKFVIR